MKSRFVNFLAVFALMSFAAPAIANAKPFEVRGIRWGMSEAQVRAIEKLEPITSADNNGIRVIGYTEQLELLPAGLFYRFVKDKVHQVMYQLEGEGWSCKQLIEKFSAIERQLTEKYGSGKGDAPERLNQDTCRAAKNWALEDTKIELSLTKVGSQVMFYVQYESIALAAEAQKASSNASSGKL